VLVNTSVPISLYPGGHLLLTNHIIVHIR